MFRAIEMLPFSDYSSSVLAFLKKLELVISAGFKIITLLFTK